ncbi:MAG: hypothetical protein AAF493_13960 [Pseudomonadota bacterium]
MRLALSPVARQPATAAHYAGPSDGRLRGRASGWGADLGYPGLIVDPSGDEIPGYVLTSEHFDKLWAQQRL